LEHQEKRLRPPVGAVGGTYTGAARGAMGGVWILCGAVAWAALLLYGSLLPFNFDFRALTPTDWFGLSRIAFHDSSLEDIVVNLLIYIPLGLFVAGAISTRRSRRPSAEAPPLEKGGLGGGRIVIAVAISAALSVAVEAIQTACPSRVASWTDVVLNTVGSGIGALLVVFLGARGGSIIRRVGSALADRPFNAVASALVIAILVYDVAPFDFVTTTSDLHASFSRARIVPIRLPDLFAASQTTHMVGEMQGAAWFLVLGYLLAFAGREIGRHPAAALASALRHGVGLAGLIEFMQLFTRSHTFDAFTIVLRAVGVALGAWCAVFFVDAESRSPWRIRPALAVPTPLLAFAALFQAALLFLPAIGVAGWSLQNLHWNIMSAGSLHSLPFEALWRAPAKTAAMDLASKFVIYGSLVVTFAAFLRRFHVDRAALLATLAVVTLAGLAECCRSAATAHSPDLTVVLVAGGSGLLVRWLDRFIRQSQSVCENSLSLAGRGSG